MNSEEDSNNPNSSGEELSTTSDEDSDSKEDSDVSSTSNDELDHDSDDSDEISESEENPIPNPLLDYSSTTKEFRDYYMSQLTNGFGEDLDKIRKEQTLDSNRLEVLIDSLESGIKIFSDIERELILLSSHNHNK